MALCDALEAKLREERAAAAQVADALCQAITATQPSVPAPAAKRADDALVLPKDAELETIPRLSQQQRLGFAAPIERNDRALHTNGTLAQSTLGLADTSPNENSAYTAVCALLAERGVLTNSEVQAALDLDAATARALLRQLVAEGAARQEGQRRGMRYVEIARQ